MNHAGNTAAIIDGCASRPGLQRLRFLPAGDTVAAELRWSGSDGDVGGWHEHHLICDAICLTLKRIVDLSDGELGLYDTWQARCAEGGSRFWLVFPVGRKYWDLAEIPRDAGRCPSGGHIRRVSLLFAMALRLVPGQASGPLRR